MPTAMIFQKGELRFANIVEFAAGDKVVLDTKGMLGPCMTQGQILEMAGRWAGEISPPHWRGLVAMPMSDCCVVVVGPVIRADLRSWPGNSAISEIAISRPQTLPTRQRSSDGQPDAAPARRPPRFHIEVPRWKQEELVRKGGSGLTCNEIRCRGA
jgi:hypothetical protein